MRRSSLVCATLFFAAGLLVHPAHAGPSLADRVGQRFQDLSDGFARAVGRSLPLIAASSGVEFVYDPETGAYERTSSSAAQLYLERAEAVGRGHWTLSLSYQHVAFDRFEGHDLDHLVDWHPVVADDGEPLFVLPHTSIDIQADVVTASATVGLGHDVDVNLTIPAVYSSLNRSDRVRFLYEGANPRPMETGSAGSATGIGDIVLRAKYAWLRGRVVDAAFGLLVRLPSADAGAFHGAGTLGVAPLVYVSSPRWETGPSIRWQVHMNVGFDFDADDIAQSEGRWGAGVDVGIGRRVRLAAALLGRHEVSRLIPSGAVDLPRCLEAIPYCQANKTGSRKGRLPVFGFDGRRADYVDVSIGGRVHLWQDTVIAFANVILPLLDQGLTTDPIPMAGIEAVF